MESSLSVELVKAVADAEGVDPTELDHALEEYVDVAAIDQLATGRTVPWTLTFDLPEYEITITRDESILVTERNDTFGGRLGDQKP